MTTKTATVTITEDTEILGYGIVKAGTYLVEMPTHYSPVAITATDIVYDHALRIVTEMVVALVTDVTPNRGTVARVIWGLDDLPMVEDARDRYVWVPTGTKVGARIWFTESDVIRDVHAELT